MPFASLSVDSALILLREREPIVLDLRDAASFERGHLPGARHFSDALLHELVKTRKWQHPLLLYCYRGHSSKEVAQLLAGMGFSQVHELDTGWQGWLHHRTPTDPELPPLLEASAQGNLAAVRAALAQGGDPTAATLDGNGAVWLACVGENPEVVRAVVAAGADPNHPNREGNTALMYAASAGKGVMVTLLLELGADPTLRNVDDTTALELASDLQSLKALRRAMGLSRT